jgi:hypothetical protein
MKKINILAVISLMALAGCTVQEYPPQYVPPNQPVEHVYVMPEPYYVPAPMFFFSYHPHYRPYYHRR